MRVDSINFFRTSLMCSDCKKYFLQSGAEKFNCPSQFKNFDSPFCSLCVIFVILIRIYRMEKSVHARERAREGFAVAKGKTGSAVLLQSLPGLSIRAQKTPSDVSRVGSFKLFQFKAVLFSFKYLLKFTLFRFIKITFKCFKLFLRLL